MLFNKRLLQNYLNNFDLPKDYDFRRVQKILGNWQESIKNGNYDKTKETRVQSAFLSKFFGIILGYSEMHDSPNEWYLINEAKTEIDGTKADGALGYFSKNKNITRAVIELKDANTPLDKKQSTRKDYDSPVSQAFSYSSKFDRCDWIIVSNFKEIRLYNKDRGQGYYESFEILKLDDEKEFKRFYFCLSKQNLLDENRNSLLDRLVKDTSKNEEEITKDFYKDYKNLRKFLFEHICEHNPNIDKKCLLEKTQKLLDRLVFVMFCEDSNISLLPPFTLKNYYETGKNLPIPTDEKIWPIIKGLFTSIDKGNSDVKPPINRYNGGLFAYDEILDNIKIKDSAWEEVIKLANYDFESDLNVNILGHIFEQSLNDLEQIKAEIDGIEQDKQKSKRKKDGIFYTPEYITRYIVEQTIGAYLDENPDKLETIKILDPACGSGAFLNQAHTFLQKQYKIRTEEKINSEKSLKRGGEEFVKLNLFEHQNMAEVDRSILLNNIYGVDLNSESTEITKLALWLKTAKKDEPLQNLDANIKCGNSLIDDPNVAGEKAFNWNEEFKAIMDDGGFDVIIGNPPYLRIQGLKENMDNETTYFEKNYKSATGHYDLYVLFIEKAFKLLKTNGKLCFILPNKFINSDFGVGIRKLISDNKALSSIIHFGSTLVFDDAATYTCILTLTKKLNNFFKFTECSPKELFNVEFRQFNINTLEKDKWIFTSKQNENIINKIFDAKYNINEIFQGIYQGIVTGDNKAFCLKNCIEYNNTIEGFSEVIKDRIKIEKNITKKLITGQDINKYHEKFNNQYIIYPYKENALIDEFTLKNLYPSCYEYLNLIKSRLEKRGSKNMKYSSWYALWNNRNYNNLEKIKIITPDVCYGTSMILDKNGDYYYNDTAYAFIKKLDCNIDYKYLITILNSKILWFFLKNTGTTLRGGYFRFKTSYLKNFKFPDATEEQQTNLAQKADQMIELNKQLHNGIDSAIELIKAEYQPKKISKNLEKFYTLGIHPFIEELEKQKVKLTLSQKEELIAWYKEKSEKLNQIQSEIDKLDKNIDQEVYKLYNLTEEEIKIIENN